MGRNLAPERREHCKDEHRNLPTEGTWLITHDHESVPFDAQTGRALIDLQP